MIEESKHFYKNCNVLITGGASFIGSHLAKLLVSLGAKVSVADDLSSGNLNNISSIINNLTFLQMDLRIPSNAEKACSGKDVIFHLAAEHGGRGYIETHPLECLSNMALDNIVFSSAARANVKKIIFASSACVYPIDLQKDNKSNLLLEEEQANFTERGKAFADGEYGWAKLMGELQLRAIWKQFGISGIACRIFTAYGERENESHAVIALIAKAILRMDPYPIWGDGLQTRNFTYVQDTVTGLALAAANLSGYQTINIGTSKHHTILELIEEIFKAFDWRPKVINKELDRPVGVMSRSASNVKCLELLNWQPSWTLSSGIERTCSWYQSIQTKDHLSHLERLLMERS